MVGQCHWRCCGMLWMRKNMHAPISHTKSCCLPMSELSWQLFAILFEDENVSAPRIPLRSGTIFQIFVHHTNIYDLDGSKGPRSMLSILFTEQLWRKKETAPTSWSSSPGKNLGFWTLTNGLEIACFIPKWNSESVQEILSMSPTQMDDTRLFGFFSLRPAISFE